MQKQRAVLCNSSGNNGYCTILLAEMANACKMKISTLLVNDIILHHTLFSLLAKTDATELGPCTSNECLDL